MLIKRMLPISERSRCASDTCIKVWRDRYVGGRLNQGDHVFIRWGNHTRYDFSDPGAKKPFLAKLDEKGTPVPKTGLVVFAINLYDHSGLAFSLARELGERRRPGEYDTTYGAAYLYVDKRRFCSFQGEERWMHVPTEPDDWGAPWRPAKDMHEFRLLTLLPLAQQEVDEMNLIEQGSSYGWSECRGRHWTKTYDDGVTEDGCDWETEPGVDDECGGCLTEHADDIEFTRSPDVPVYYEPDVCLLADRDRGLDAYEYTIPEFIVHAPAATPCSFYAGDGADGKPTWTEDRGRAKVFYRMFDAIQAAQKALGTDDGNLVRRAYTEKDNWKVKKETRHGAEEKQG
jgi:hypothetical protein